MTTRTKVSYVSRTTRIYMTTQTKVSSVSHTICVSMTTQTKVSYFMSYNMCLYDNTDKS